MVACCHATGVSQALVRTCPFHYQESGFDSFLGLNTMPEIVVFYLILRIVIAVYVFAKLCQATSTPLKICHISIYIRIFGKLLAVLKERVPFLCKTTPKEFQFSHKSYTTTVAMVTVTLQDGGYFGFEVT